VSARSNYRIFAFIAACFIGLGTASAANAQTDGSGGAVAQQQLIPNVTVSISGTSVFGGIGSSAVLYDGTDCYDCGDITSLYHGGNVSYKLLKTPTQTLVYGTAVYQQVNSRGVFLWKHGKSYIDAGWNGGKISAKVTVRINHRKTHMRLVAATESLLDTSKPQVPLKSGVCDPKVMECSKD
jgi:hypothetical protein